MLPVIGLTGGIGAGKSYVAQLFAQHGAGLIDADAVSRGLTTTGGAAIPLIAQTFGADFVAIDGAMDRAKMRDLAFSYGTAKLKLEAILHPLIRAALDAQLLALSSAGVAKYIIAEIPLLFAAADYGQRYSRIVVVDCTIGQQIDRVQARSKLTREAALSIIARQTPRQVRLQLADDVVSNEGETSALAPQILALHEKYLKLR